MTVNFYPSLGLLAFKLESAQRVYNFSLATELREFLGPSNLQPTNISAQSGSCPAVCASIRLFPNYCLRVLPEVNVPGCFQWRQKIFCR